MVNYCSGSVELRKGEEQRLLFWTSLLCSCHSGPRRGLGITELLSHKDTKPQALKDPITQSM